MDAEQFRPHFSGPFPSISTPFCRNGQIDDNALRRQIDFIIEAGSKIVLLTAGDSHLLCLSDDEIAHLTAVAARHSRGRALVVAADRHYDTARAVAFADYARQQGADMVMALPPDWSGSCTVDSLVAHFAAVAAHLPVMLVTGAFAARGSDFALAAIERILDQVPGVVAIKDDLCGDFARRLCLLAHSRAVLFAGGRKENHLNMRPYGCDGYMSAFMSFQPAIAHRYWAAVEADDLATARQIIGDIEIPYFDHIRTLTGGWNAGYHATLELFGVSDRWRRPPYYSLNDEEMAQLKTHLATLDLL